MPIIERVVRDNVAAYPESIVEELDHQVLFEALAACRHRLATASTVGSLPWKGRTKELPRQGPVEEMAARAL